MTIEQALKLVRDICEAVNLSKAQHDTVQQALSLISEKCTTKQ